MIYLLLGEDRQAKAQKIDEIKSSCLPTSDALKLDYESLDSVKLNSEDLKKALIALPAVGKKRFVLIRTADKLNTHNKKIIEEFVQSDHRHIVLVLVSEELNPKQSFLRDLMNGAEVIRFGKREKKNDIWDVTRAIESRNSAQALKFLSELIQAGDSPLKIMGALVWFWGSLKNRLSADSFKKGLLVLQEADLNIKRSRMRPEFAVEMVVTKLSLLTAC